MPTRNPVEMGRWTKKSESEEEHNCNGIVRESELLAIAAATARALTIYVCLNRMIDHIIIASAL